MYRRRNSFGTFGTLLAVMWLIIILGVIGWCMNLYKLANADWEAPYKEEALRGIGVIPFVGGIMGYFDIDDTTKKDIDDIKLD